MQHDGIVNGRCDQINHNHIDDVNAERCNEPRSPHEREKNLKVNENGGDDDDKHDVAGDANERGQLEECHVVVRTSAMGVVFSLAAVIANHV